MIGTGKRETTSQQTAFEVEGMTCGSCVRHVNHALEGVSGVEAVEVRRGEGLVLVRHGALATPAAMIDALSEAGYPARVTGR